MNKDSDNNRMYIKVERIDRHEAERFRDIYHEAFPVEEQRPWDTMFPQGDDLHGPFFLGAYSGMSLTSPTMAPVGMLTFWTFDDFVYIEHFAVDSRVRGRGIGRELFRGIAESLHRESGLPIVLEVEPESEENPMAARRIDFYRRLGFEVIDVNYVQPPYSDGLQPVDMWIMSDSVDIDIDNVTRRLYEEVYKFCS